MSRTRNSADIAPQPFTHDVAVARLSREPEEENRFTVRPDEAERARVAAFLGLEAVERLTLSGTLVPAGRGWEFRGQLTATVVQSCVVTLEPVRDVVDVPVRRRYAPESELAVHGAEVELGADDLDGPDPLGATIDLGALAVETLALSVDPWPRAEGVEMPARQAAPPGAQPITDEDTRPFAKLRVLRGGKAEDAE